MVNSRPDWANHCFFLEKLLLIELMNSLKLISFSFFVLLIIWVSTVLSFSGVSPKTEPLKAEILPESSLPLADFEPSPAAFSATALRPDFILSSYRDEASRNQVVDFFSRIVKSPELAAIILTNADSFNISPSLAFALCWEESRYNAQAVNRNNRNGTVDRGLFQLNGPSFPQIQEEDFFNPSINAYYGMAHLRWCIDSGGSVIAGLAMYNAGTTRVQQNNTPKNTLDYISRVLEYQSCIEEFFRSK
jgi:hypothetical protein